jgi:predicted permease
MMMDRLRMDLRDASRSLRKSPAFSALAVLTLAMAMAVSTAIFSIVSGIFMADLPMDEPDRIAFVWGGNTASGQNLQNISMGTYIDVVEGLQTADLVGAMEQTGRVLIGRGDPARLSAAAVTPDFMEIWGVAPHRGRGISPRDVAPGAPPVVMLSHGFWSRSMGEDPDAVGQTLTLDGQPHAIVGIAPPEMEFGGLGATEIWVPLRLDRASPPRMDRSLMTTVRLAPGASLEQLQAEVASRWESLAAREPEMARSWRVEARSTQASLVNESARTILLLLGIIVGVVLLIACVNTANMMLARGARRSRELAVRAALGAGRRAILRPLLAESLILSVAATALGLVASSLLLRGLADLTRDTDALFTTAEMDGRVLGFSIALALLAPLVFGLLPALRASRTDVSRDLGERSAGSGAGLGRLRSTLVGAQVALAMVALVVGGLLIRSGIEMQQLGSDYRQEGILTASFLRPSAVSDAGDDFFLALMDEVGSVPGVTGAAMVSELPRRGASVRAVEPEGAEPTEDVRRVYESVITPGYLDLLAVPVLEGRDFGAGDGPDAVPVALVTRSLATALWPGGDAVGRRFRVDGEGGEQLRVVGVVGEVRRRQDGSAIPQFYRPLAQSPRAAMTLVAGTIGDPEAWSESVRAATWAVDPDQPVEAVVSLRAAEFHDMSVNWAIFGLFALFAAFALVMAAAGIYGVVSYSVASRTPEFGIRLALGASPWAVRTLVLRQGVGVAALGVVIGLGGAWVAAGLMESMVVGVSPRDPLTFVAVPLVLLAVAVVANWAPAVRATRVDPVRALRDD